MAPPPQAFNPRIFLNPAPARPKTPAGAAAHTTPNKAKPLFNKSFFFL